jgi:DNA polymerase-3 subunit alpha
MAFVTLEDSYGSIECIVFPKVLTEYSVKLAENNIVAIRGRVSIREDEEPKLLAETVELIDEAMMKKVEPKRLYIKLSTKNDENLELVKENLAPYQGDMQVCLFFEDTKKMALAPRRLWFNNTPSAILELKKIFGEENIRIK